LRKIGLPSEELAEELQKHLQARSSEVYSIEATPVFDSSSGQLDLGNNLQITANFTIF
jgi:hypothetical protein